MTRIGKLIGGRSRSEGNCEAIFQIAREVVERRRSMQGALNEVRHPAILDNLSDEDFRLLDEAIVESAAGLSRIRAGAGPADTCGGARQRLRPADRRFGASARFVLAGRRSEPRAGAAPARCLHHRPAGRLCPRRPCNAGATWVCARSTPMSSTAPAQSFSSRWISATSRPTRSRRSILP